MGNPEQNPPVTDDVLAAVNDAMVSLHLRYHSREPGTSRTQLLGPDLLACLMGDVYTDVEKTMIELQRHALVAETRSAFQQAMERRFVSGGRAPDGPTRGAVHLDPQRGAGPRDRAVRARILTGER